MMSKITQWLALPVLTVSLGFLAVGCEEKPQTLGEAVDEAADNAQDAAEDVADGVDDAARDVADGVKDATE